MGGSWTAEVLMAIATIASSIFKHHDVFPTDLQDQSYYGIGQSYAQDQDQGQTDTTSSSFGLRDQHWVDYIQHERVQGGPSDSFRAQRSDSDHRAGVTTDGRASNYGSVCLPRRGGNFITGRRHLREHTMKSGNVKRLRGEWRKSSQVLAVENELYNKSASTMDRPSPSADLLLNADL